jgi:hypothetical protein
MRAYELIAAAIIGALLLSFGYELGRSVAPVRSAQPEPLDTAALEAQIQARVEEKVVRRERELVGSVVAQVEQLLSREPKPRLPEKPVSEQQPQQARVKQLEKEFDKLLASVEAQAKQKARVEKEGTSRRRREPLSAADLRAFEDARRQELERRRKKEEEEKRRKRR